MNVFFFPRLNTSLQSNLLEVQSLPYPWLYKGLESGREGAGRDGVPPKIWPVTRTVEIAIVVNIIDKTAIVQSFPLSVRCMVMLIIHSAGRK